MVAGEDRGLLNGKSGLDLPGDNLQMVAGGQIEIGKSLKWILALGLNKANSENNS